MMGAYSYCHKCDGGMAAPTVREAFSNEWQCSHCGCQHTVDDSVRAELLIELEERITTIEQHLGLS
jgi:hypothetical protein